MAALSNAELESEIETLEAMYDKEELTINTKDNLMVIDYLTKINHNKIKIIFAFNINDIASSIIITVKNTERNKNNLTQTSFDLITTHLKKKFEDEIENMPIYQCIDYFNNELKQNQSLFDESKASTKSDKKSKSQQNDNNNKQNNKHKNKKKSKKHKPIVIEEEKKIDSTKNESETDIEFVAFIRFNHLLNGKQHKKENQMLSELKSLKNCSNSFFAYYFYGTPGIICICSTSNIIKQFARRCNEIGKKSLISYIHTPQNSNPPKIDKNTIKTIDHDHNEKLRRNEVKELINNLEINGCSKQKNEDKLLSEILCGTGTDFESINNMNDTNKKEIYHKDYKYDFQIEIKTSNGPYATTNGNLYMTIFGEDDNIKLVDRHRFEVKADDQLRKKKKRKYQI